MLIHHLLISLTKYFFPICTGLLFEPYALDLIFLSPQESFSFLWLTFSYRGGTIYNLILRKGTQDIKNVKFHVMKTLSPLSLLLAWFFYGPPDWKWPSQTWKASSCCNPPFSICHSDSWSFAGNLYFSPLKKSLFPGVLEFHDVTWNGSFPRHYAVYLVEIKSFLHYFLPFAFSELPFRHSYSDVDLILSFLLSNK